MVVLIPNSRFEHTDEKPIGITVHLAAHDFGPKVGRIDIKGFE